MGRTTTKRSSSTANKSSEGDTSDSKSTSTSDSENEENQAGDRKRLKKSDKEWSGNESENSEESSDANQSEVEAKAKKRTKGETKSSSKTDTANTKKRVKIEKKQGWAKALEVEAIITHRVSDNLKKVRKYQLKLKDMSTLWVSSQMLRAVFPELLRQYNDDIKNGKLVEAIVSHEKQKNRSIKYLLKWADKSKGQTWETKETALRCCPNLLKPYIEKMEQEEAESYAVAAILKHKLVYHKSKYLIKWKDKKKGETWETARRTIALCPEILDRYTMKNPDCVPKMYKKESVDRVGLSREKRSLKYKNMYSTPPNLLDDFDDDVDWEVERIMDICNKRDGTREFLVRWKGFRSAYDSWLPEADLDCPELLENFLKMKERRDEKRALIQYKNGKLRKEEKPKGRRADKNGKLRKEEKPKGRRADKNGKIRKEEKTKDRRAGTIKKSLPSKRLSQRRSKVKGKKK